MSIFDHKIGSGIVCIDGVPKWVVVLRKNIFTKRKNETAYGLSYDWHKENINKFKAQLNEVQIRCETEAQCERLAAITDAPMKDPESESK